MQGIQEILQKVQKGKAPEKEKISPTVDSAKAQEIFIKHANKLVPGFEIDSENEAVIVELIKYFNFEECKYDHGKGIILMGNVGSGKTEIMKIFKACNFPNRQFGMKECRDMSELFLNEHYKGIYPFSKGAVKPNRISHMLFDDLGAENVINYYGNKVNVMSDIIIDRYKHFVESKLITHYTTNLTMLQIEEEYGARVSSRLKQTNNIVILGGSSSSKDRRR